MIRTGDWEIGVVSGRLPDNPGELACMLLFNRFCKVKCTLTRKPEMLIPGNTENRKCGNPDYSEIGKSEINQRPKAIPTIRDSCIRLGLLFDVETCKR